MDISVVIPTHNRSQSLKRAINSILDDTIKSEYEIVVVDNNSKDDTKDVVAIYESKVKYYFEPNTSFTRARHTGAINATGDILLYIDDDVIVIPGSIDNVVKLFNKYSNCGVIAAKILPQYEKEPPEWCIACEKTFNGWSLYNPSIYPNLKQGFQEVNWAAGPMMAISKKVYDLVGGFPPDTLGIETNDGKCAFNKLYVGPGDYGLCINAQKKDYKVYYAPDVSCYHVIPAIRFTIAFWISRMKGEAHHKAIVNREFFKYSKFKLYKERVKARKQLFKLQLKLLKRIELEKAIDEKKIIKGLYSEELFFFYQTDFIAIEKVLNKYKWLSKYLWELGKFGVPDSDFESVNRKLPIEYKDLYLKENMYPEKGIDSMNDLQKNESNFGFLEFKYKYLYPIIKSIR